MYSFAVPVKMINITGFNAHTHIEEGLISSVSSL